MVEKALGSPSQPDPELSGLPGGPDNEREHPMCRIFCSVLQKEGSSIAGREALILRGWPVPRARCDPRQSDVLVGKPCLSAR